MKLSEWKGPWPVYAEAKMGFWALIDRDYNFLAHCLDIELQGMRALPDAGWIVQDWFEDGAPMWAPGEPVMIKDWGGPWPVYAEDRVGHKAIIDKNFSILSSDTQYFTGCWATGGAWLVKDWFEEHMKIEVGDTVVCINDSCTFSDFPPQGKEFRVVSIDEHSRYLGLWMPEFKSWNSFGGAAYIDSIRTGTKPHWDISRFRFVSRPISQRFPSEEIGVLVTRVSEHINAESHPRVFFEPDCDRNRCIAHQGGFLHDDDCAWLAWRRR